MISSHGGPGRRARAAAALAAVILLAAGTACSDDDEAGGADRADGTGALSLDELRAATSDAPAVQESEVEVSNGPTGPPPVDGVGQTVITITDAGGNVTACCVMVAASPQQRERGLMEVTEMNGYGGMLFVWESDTGGGFWMRNTPTPLSIAWYAADGSFVSSAEMAPCGDSDSCPTYYPEGDYRFALETFEGELAAMGAGPGSTLTVGGECPSA
jgi:uncharacterized protein